MMYKIVDIYKLYQCDRLLREKVNFHVGFGIFLDFVTPFQIVNKMKPNQTLPPRVWGSMMLKSLYSAQCYK